MPRRTGGLRRGRAVALALAVTVALAGCFGCGSGQASDGGSGGNTVRIAYLKSGLLAIAKSRGAFEERLAERGVRVEWVGPFPNFAPALEATIAGSADLSSGGDIPAISSMSGDVPLCLLGARPPQPQAEAILVKEDSGIWSVEDLAGKKVAGNSGGWGEDLLLRALEDAGVPKDEVELVDLDPPDAGLAFSRGQVDAWSVWDPYVATAEVEQDARRIVSGGVADHYGVYIANEDFLEAGRENTEAVLAELETEGAWATGNPKKATEFLGEEVGLSQPVVERTAEHRPNETIVPLDEEIRSDLQEAADWLHDSDVIPTPVEIADQECPVQAGEV